MEKLEMMYEGKAKKIYATDKADEVVVYYKDDATAFNICPRPAAAGWRWRRL